MAWGIGIALHVIPTTGKALDVRVEYPNIRITDEQHREHIKIHAVAYFSNSVIDGVKSSELSDLAWDDDEELLYILSDNAYILAFKPIFKSDRLHDLLFVSHFFLRDEAGKKLKWKNADSEGLALLNADNLSKNDTQFIVSFERRPRVIRYRADGSFDAPLNIPEKLSAIENYRSENKSLEAVVQHPIYGLMLGAEFPLKDEKKNRLGLYTLDGTYRTFPAHFIDGALTGVALTKHHDLIAIERAYGGLFSGFKVALHHLKINDSGLKNTVIARFLSADGFFNDNFEGIERHKDNFYFMVSDDNNHPLQRGILIYFSYDEDAQ